MTTFILDTTSSAAYTVGFNDALLITARGTLAGAPAVAFSPGGFISVEGAILAGYGTAILSPSGSGSATGSSYTSAELDFGPAAAVSAGTAISVSGAYYLHFRSAGYVSGVNTGMYLATSALDIVNSGTILADGYGIYDVGAYVQNVVNSGTISSSGTGIFASVTASGFGAGRFSLLNSGVITAPTALQLGGETDRVTNSGVITGTVVLGDGDDLFDTSGGRVSGVVSGGAGADTLIGSSQRDVFYGDNVTGDTSGGADVLYGGFGDDVLNGGYGNDALYGNQDNDVLYGNQDDDWLHGGQGDDVLFGGQGNDTLNGGKGDDVLNGNLGDDLFVFDVGFGHDRITDFGLGADRIQLSTDLFGDFAALQAHAVAVSNGTLITDAAGDTLLLVGVAPASLTPAQFVFA